MIRRPRRSTPFPYPTFFRSGEGERGRKDVFHDDRRIALVAEPVVALVEHDLDEADHEPELDGARPDGGLAARLPIKSGGACGGVHCGQPLRFLTAKPVA